MRKRAFTYTSFKCTVWLCAHVGRGPVSTTAKWWDISFSSQLNSTQFIM